MFKIFDEIKPESILIDKKMIRAESSLQSLPDWVLEQRKNLILQFNKIWYYLMPIMDRNEVFTEKTLANIHMRQVKLVLKSIVNEFFDRANRQIPVDRSEPDVAISRRKAMMFADTGNVDHAGTSTTFGQIVTNLDQYYA